MIELEIATITLKSRNMWIMVTSKQASCYAMKCVIPFLHYGNNFNLYKIPFFVRHAMVAIEKRQRFAACMYFYIIGYLIIQAHVDLPLKVKT